MLSLEQVTLELSTPDKNRSSINLAHGVLTFGAGCFKGFVRYLAELLVEVSTAQIAYAYNVGVILFPLSGVILNPFTSTNKTS